MSPHDIDKLKFYMAIVYMRRIKKAGYFDDDEKTSKSSAKQGDSADFAKLFL